MQPMEQPIAVHVLLRGGITSMTQYIAARNAPRTLIQDEIHGQYQLGILSSLILRHPEIGRLAGLKQLGCCYKRFPEANHNRFQHSRGVGYLAGKWALHVAQQQQREGAQLHPPHTMLTPLDIELIELAGLCHDLGHGPFSHVFESNITKCLGITGWHHEALSGLLLKHMLAGLLKDHGMLTEHELLYGHPESAGLQLLHTLAGAVTDLIAGNNLSGYWQHKQFALQIVASKADADKVDYLMRDLLRSGALLLEGMAEVRACIPPSQQQQQQRYPDFVQLIYNSRLVDGRICLNEADQQLVELLFRTRRLMHEHVYQLTDVKGYEIMLSHVLGLCVHCLDLEWLKRHETLAKAGFAAEREFISWFCGLTDALLDEARRRALHNPPGAHGQRDSRRELALQVVRAFDRGEVLGCVEEEDPKGMMGASMECEKAAQAVIQFLQGAGCSGSSSSSGSGGDDGRRCGLSCGDIQVVYVKLDHGHGEKDPLSSLSFWSEDADGCVSSTLGKWRKETMPPGGFLTRKVRVYLTKLCSPQQQAQYSVSLQLALRAVIQQQQAAAEPAKDVTAAGTAAAEGYALAAPAESEEDEEEEMQAEQLSFCTPAGAAAGAHVSVDWQGTLPFSQLNSQVASCTQHQTLTQTAAAAAYGSDMSPVRQFTPCSGIDSPALITPQQRRQLLLPPSCQADLSADRMQAHGSLQPAATMASVGSAASIATAAAATTTPPPAAAAAAEGDKRVPRAVAKIAFESLGLLKNDTTAAPKKAGGKKAVAGKREGPQMVITRHTRHKGAAAKG